MYKNNYVELNNQKVSPFDALSIPRFMKDSMNTIVEDSVRQLLVITTPADYETFAAEAKEAGLRILAENNGTADLSQLGIPA
jgi:hypothetical protein